MLSTNNLPREARPWTRWWWMGNALTEAEIERHLDLFKGAGFGGVEVSPIYGPKGSEGRFVEFLSPRWVGLFSHTIREAQKRDLGVDLICGTGWPFGAPWVTDEDAARVAWVEALPAGDAPAVSKRKPEAKPLAEQPAPDGKRRHVLFLAPTGQQVKRAAPGGDGNVLDHFGAAAVRHYVAHFDVAFDAGALPRWETPRAFFNDSWEVFGANATPLLLDEFRHLRGYDLRDHLDALAGDADPDTVTRVRSDYRQTVHDWTLDVFLGTWANWARRRGSLARNQAHGSPGNLLDLYAAADIPETEVFGPVRLKQAGLKPLTELPPDFGEAEEALICRFASSAAHVAGKRLCSSESFTWLGEHGHVPLEHMKAEVDTLFALGINHIFYHGTPFSPGDVPWPGWLFYATTLVAPTNPFWRDLPALNAYIAHCQSWLQQGVPDNDLLLYFPFHDLIAGEAGAHDLLQFMTVHKTETWLRGNLPEFVATARRLTERGYAFDLISDKQLAENVTAEGGTLKATGGAKYKAILVAGCRRMPPETMERLSELARNGAAVLFAGSPPDDVPGLADVAARKARLTAARGAASFRQGAELDPLLEAAGVPREAALAAQGVEFCRRRLDDGSALYFLANPGTKDVDAPVALSRPVAGGATLLDPLSAVEGAISPNASGGVHLQLPAGAALLLRTGGGDAATAWRYAEPAGPATILPGPWQVSFIEGGPTLPAARQTLSLTSWTQWDDPALTAFSGTARYATTFDLPGTTARAWRLELGEVCYSARVRVNGQEAGVVFARPWHNDLPADLLRPTGNTLEIEVTNLMANRLADLERREGAAWRPFLMVNIHYKPFDAARWAPVPSGLLGPVRVVPLT